jgi:hypothetical protein
MVLVELQLLEMGVVGTKGGSTQEDNHKEREKALAMMEASI